MNKRKNISSRSSLRLRSLFLISVSILPILTTSSTSVAQSPTPNPGMSTQANLQRALVLPQEVIKQQVEIAANMVRPRGALPWNRTSDFMLGTVAVAIILPQCVNGAACRETWTQAEINEVRAEVQSGLDWWTQKAAMSGANVQFQVVLGQPQVVNSVNVYTKSHLGWRDFDGDQIPDPIDTDPHTVLQAYSPDPTSIRNPTYYGNAQDIAIHTDNGLYQDVTINKIQSVEYQIDNGPWTAAIPVDGVFNSAYEEFRFTPLLCENRSYSIKARSTNSVGHRSPVVSDSLTVSSSSRCWNG